jgi:hypothetical protein
MITLDEDEDDIDEDNNYPSLVAVASVVIGIGALSLLKHQYHNIAEEDEFIMQYILPPLRRGSVNRYYALQRRHRQRQKWATFQQDLTDRQFRRYFRMSKFLFRRLCDHIEDFVGPEEFKSEKYLEARLLSPPKFANNIIHAHQKSTGGMICGEVKLAMTLRILGGGSYLDMAMIFKSTFNHANKLFVRIVNNWLCHSSFYPINGVAYLNDEKRMAKVATEFAQSSCGVINGCIGALDGWVVKIRKPTLNVDEVNEPSSFYSRKGYFSSHARKVLSLLARPMVVQFAVGCWD